MKGPWLSHFIRAYYVEHHPRIICFCSFDFVEKQERLLQREPRLSDAKSRISNDGSRISNDTSRISSDTSRIPGDTSFLSDKPPISNDTSLVFQPTQNWKRFNQNRRFFSYGGTGNMPSSRYPQVWVNHRRRFCSVLWSGVKRSYSQPAHWTAANDDRDMNRCHSGLMSDSRGRSLAQGEEFSVCSTRTANFTLQLHDNFCSRSSFLCPIASVPQLINTRDNGADR